MGVGVAVRIRVGVGVAVWVWVRGRPSWRRTRQRSAVALVSAVADGSDERQLLSSREARSAR